MASTTISRRARRPRQKCAEGEREVVQLRRARGIHAERVPLSGAAHYQGSGADVDIYPLRRDEAPMVSEVKARGNGEGFVTLEKWLGENDALFLIRDRSEPLVMLPWASWVRLVEKPRRP